MALLLWHIMNFDHLCLCFSSTVCGLRFGNEILCRDTVWGLGLLVLQLALVLWVWVAAGFKVVSRACTPFHPWVDSTYVSEPQFKVN